MDSLENMSIKEIIQKIGICLLENDIDMIFTNNQRGREALSKINELYNKNMRILNEIKQTDNPVIAKVMAGNDAMYSLNRRAAEKVMVEYEDVVNKPLFVLISTYNIYKLFYGEKDRENRRSLKNKAENGIKILGTTNLTTAIPQYEDLKDVIVRLKIINSVELVNSIKNGKSFDATKNSSKKKLARLDDINKKLLLINIVHVLMGEDIKGIISSCEEVGMALFFESIYNASIEYQRKYNDSIMDFRELCTQEDTSLIDQIGESMEYYECVIDAIKQNSKYIDIDRLLLISAYRYIRRLELDEYNEDDLDSYRRLLIQMYGEIKPETEIHGIINIDEEKLEDYSLRELENDLYRFVDGRYIKKEESNRTKERLLANEVTLDELNGEEVELISVTGEELIKFATNSEDNAIYIIRREIIKRDEIVTLLYAMKSCGEKLFIYLCNNDLLSVEEMRELLEDGVITADIIAKIPNPDLLEKMVKLIKDKLVELYQELLIGRNNNEEIEYEMFNKYSMLYKSVNLAGKNEEELFDEAFNLISSFEDIDSNMLQELYQFGLIPLEAMADWGVNLNDMLSSNSLKPTDMKRLYAKDIISIEDIKNVLLNGGLLYEEKLDLIYSTFDGDSEEENAIREELIELLETGESYRTSRGTKKGKSSNDGTFKSREFITDPHSRWKLISLLDKDYSKKFLPIGKDIKDGHRVFLLPNLDKIVIEKMHEKRNGRKVSAYGSATYIMATDDFFRNMEVIIADEAINRTALRELFEEQRAAKILHTKNWGKHIKDYFGIHTEDERYTSEEIMAIDKAIQAVVNSRRERD